MLLAENDEHWFSLLQVIDNEIGEKFSRHSVLQFLVRLEAAASVNIWGNRWTPVHSSACATAPSTKLWIAAAAAAAACCVQTILMTPLTNRINEFCAEQLPTDDDAYASA